ncbi:hypothetical protein L3Y34_019101 [Caenorhabditis briggsae]|uniref:BRCT domain-containing protein n=1 Tax=Caenorhabditis briggsae TaxID=6238 RepID=A0AAE9DP02_CAEBR|nr:hypothetical protein L3Y34_019101 [Caenorhabditis briggsae]
MLNFLLIFALIFSSTSIAKQPSDLESITDDYMTLARIINAIFLQSSLDQKDFNFRDVIVELLKVDPNVFDGILNVDAQSAVSSMTELSENVKIVNEKGQMNKLDTMKEGLRFLAEFMSEPSTASLDADKFKELKANVSSNLPDDSMFERKCDSGTLEILSNVYDNYIAGQKEQKPSEDYEKLKDALKSFSECLKKMIPFKQVYGAHPLLQIYGKYDRVMKMPNDLFQKFNQTLGMTKKLNNDLAISKVLWTRKSDQQLPKNVTDQIKNSISHSKEHYRTLEPKPPVLTVSFVEPKDLLRVPMDLKSQWFAKHFIRNSTIIKGLTKALEPFNKVSESIQDLDQEWAPFNDRHLTENILNEIYTVVDVSSKLYTDGTADGMEFDKLAEKQDAILSKCPDHRPDDEFEKTFEDFKKEENQFELAYKDMKSLLRRTLRVFYSEGESYEEQERRMNIVKKCSDETHKFLSENPADNNDKEMKKVITNTYRKYADCMQLEMNIRTDLKWIADKVISFEKRQETLVAKLVEYRNRIVAQGVPSYVDVLEKSKGLELETCLRDGGYKPAELIKPLDFALVAEKVSKHDQVKATVEYLEQILKAQTALKQVESLLPGNRTKRANASKSPLNLGNMTKQHAEDFGICSIALLNMVQVLQSKERLLKIGNFAKSVRQKMDNRLENYKKPLKAIETLLKQADDVDEAAVKLRKQNPEKWTELFDMIAEIKGILGDRQSLYEWKLNNERSWFFNTKTSTQVDSLLAVNLDFKTYQSRLLDGRFTYVALKKYFDELFGHVKKAKPHTVVVEKHHLSWPLLVGICIGSIFLLPLAFLMIFGMTKKGRRTFKNWYLFYFGKPEEFEKRWRYSCFMDKVNGENALLDAVRETNKANLLVALKRGVYVNAYNIFGNTALHAATKGGHPDLVEALIRHGADRSILNAKNRTPEQMIPVHYKQIFKEDQIQKFEKIQMIYKKYRKKSFRVRVPEIFPVFSFRIWPEERTNDDLSNNFMNVFQSITSMETSLHMTHCVVKTDENGILETDNLSLLFWMFHGCIIVKEKWMTDCLKNEKLIEQDYNYLVEKVKYNGKVFDTVIQWSQAMAKSELPYLYGVQVAVCMEEYPNMFTLTAIINSQGGTLLNEFPVKKKYKAGSHPYLHAHLGPLFIIHDGSADLSAYQKDTMFTLFTEAEFIEFMLKRDIHKDTNENPICVLKDLE